MAHKEPRNPLDPTCDRTCVKLCIYPDALDPAEVTTMLGVDPSRTQIRGERLVNSIGRERTVRVTAWFLESEGSVESRDMRDHLDWVLDRMEASPTGPSALRRLHETPGVIISLSCVWWTACGGGGPTLWPEQMGRMARLNLECSLDFADYSGPDETTEVCTE